MKQLLFEILNTNTLRLGVEDFVAGTFTDVSADGDDDFAFMGNRF